MKETQQISERLFAEILEKMANSPHNIYSLLIELANNINEVLWIWGRGKVIYVSPAYERIWGRSSQELYQTIEPLLSSIHPEDRERIIESFSRVGDQNIGYISEEFRIIRADGSLRWILMKAFPVYGEKGELLFSTGIAEDITERKRMEESLKYQSMHDALTGLYNRAYFQEEMQRMDNMRDNPVGLLIIDMDGLKTVNDRLGHLQGDQLIKDAAQLLKSCFRKNDVVARIGGDEFAVILPRTTPEALLDSVKRIQNKVAEYNRQNEIHMGLSIGQAIRLDASKGMLELYKEADDIMYANKPKIRR